MDENLVHATSDIREEDAGERKPVFQENLFEADQPSKVANSEIKLKVFRHDDDNAEKREVKEKVKDRPPVSAGVLGLALQERLEGLEGVAPIRESDGLPAPRLLSKPELVVFEALRNIVPGRAHSDQPVKRELVALFHIELDRRRKTDREVVGQRVLILKFSPA